MGNLVLAWSTHSHATHYINVCKTRSSIRIFLDSISTAPRNKGHKIYRGKTQERTSNLINMVKLQQLLVVVALTAMPNVVASRGSTRGRQLQDLPEDFKKGKDKGEKSEKMKMMKKMDKDMKMMKVEAPRPTPYPTPYPTFARPVTAAPVAKATSSPTAIPKTLAPVTGAPVTGAPVTPAPVTPAPVTAAPIVMDTPAPVTPAPVTGAPVTPAPVTPAPVTPAPVVPDTPAPVTDAPVVMETSAPITGAPVTPAPVTPAPVTPAPVTPAPVTAAPVTPAPVTPAPVTPAPVTPAPVAATPAPMMAPVPPSPGFPACNICGGTLRVTMPDVVVDIPTFGETTCGTFQTAGDTGFIEEQFCALVAGFAAPCGCAEPGTPVAPPMTPAPVTPAPVTPAPVTPAPVTAAPMGAPVPPSPGFPACSVCGEDMRVTLPDVVVNIPTFGETTCGTFETAGLTGFIEEQFCPVVTGFAAPCGCAPV